MFFPGSVPWNSLTFYKKSRHFLRSKQKSSLHEGGSTMRNSKIALVCVVKEHLNRGAFYLVLLIGICLIPFALAQRTIWRAPANIITVTNLNDSGPGSLRQALADASEGDTINFAVSGTISLTSGELVIDKSVTISGQPQSITVTRSSQTQFRIFHVMPGHDVTIDSLYITGGDPNLGSYGGAVLNDHAGLTISNCSLTTNSSTYGGAISSDSSGGSATLAVLNSSIIGNYVVFSGGGIYDNGGTLTITNSAVSNNTAAYSDNQFAVGDGGGILQQRGHADDHQQHRE